MKGPRYNIVLLLNVVLEVSIYYAAFSTVFGLTLLELFSCPSPKDLQRMRLFCRAFCRLLSSNQYEWRLSRAHLDTSFILPAASAAARVTELALARLFMNTAPSTVSAHFVPDPPFTSSQMSETGDRASVLVTVLSDFFRSVVRT
jgi:hypothetical protein